MENTTVGQIYLLYIGNKDQTIIHDITKFNQFGHMSRNHKHHIQ
jgi:hypothetical protein